MKAPATGERIDRFAAFVENSLGLHISPASRETLMLRLENAAWESGFGDCGEYMERLMRASTSRARIETLARYLTVGETYFFRDKEVFRALREQIIPAIVEQRKGGERFLRIWSAGCATGEEAYSIAILLNETIPEVSEWNITILATDINPLFLDHAVRGVYREWSFRDAPHWLRPRYFAPRSDGGFEILPVVRAMVDFRSLNLAEDAYPSLTTNTNAMDIVFCRNVLMYFAPRITGEVMRRLARSLVEGGWLIVSPTEIPHLLCPPFSTVTLSGAHLLRKNGESACAEEFARQPPAYRHTEEFIAGQTMEAIPPPAPMEAFQDGEKREPAGSDQDGGIIDRGFERAMDLYRQGFYVEVCEASPALVRDCSRRGNVFALLARSHANLGRLSLAREWCEKAIAADKLNPSYHYLLATILEEQGAPREAWMSFQRTLYVCPDFILAHYSLGHSQLRAGKKRQGEKHLRAALSLLRARPCDEVLPESEGTTAGRLEEIIRAMMEGATPHD